MASQEYKIEKTYFLGKKSRGRTTTVTHIPTGNKVVFMGIVTKKDAINNFILHN